MPKIYLLTLEVAEGMARPHPLILSVYAERLQDPSYTASVHKHSHYIINLGTLLLDPLYHMKGGKGRGMYSMNALTLVLLLDKATIHSCFAIHKH